MNRRLYQLLFLGLGCGLGCLSYFYWYDLREFCYMFFPKNTNTILLFIVGFCELAILLLYSILIDKFAPVEIVVKQQSEEERKSEAERRVASALKEQRRDAAVRIYEEAGMYMSGLKIAEEIKDTPAMARLSWRMGHYFRARKYYLHVNDFKAAADMSVLMNEIKPARELYEKAAAMFNGNGRAVDEALLWDRARNWPRAARIYEDAGEFERAAECYELLGDAEKTKSCIEQARALRAYEERTLTRDRNSMQMQLREKKNSFASQARTAELKGDLFVAGLGFREANQWMEAAICFEKIEEWERCARAYDTAGLRDRAELVKMNVAVNAAPRRDPSKQKVIAPLPSPKEHAASAVHFVPVGQLAPQPANGGGAHGGAVAMIDPRAQEELADHIRQGNFAEAARCAQAAHNWLVAAALYEHSGDLINAANTYRQIGRIEEAAKCLQQADHPHEAAMMALSIGREEEALKTLLKAVSNKNDFYAAFMLIELLIQWGRHDDALDLLKKKIAPGQFTKEHAEPYYRVARLFEKYNAYAPAHQLYTAMLQGGAQSKELEERVARLDGLMLLPAKSDSHAKPADPTVVNTLLQMYRESWNADLHSLDNVHLVETQDADQEQFHFLTPLDLKKNQKKSIGGDTSVPQVERDLSLFGTNSPSRPDLKPKDGPAKKTAVATALMAEAEDPFACAQRYELLCEIAKGGMGVIYEALDIVLGRKIALKLIQGKAAADEMKQFLLEARAIARLNHPNIVTIYDVGMMDYKHYISMELVRGGTLVDFLYSRRKLPLAEALRIFIEMARGLQAAHHAGVVHRDIKPGNILLTHEHTVKIVDFGLAKFSRKTQDGAEHSDTLFKSAGTPGYMAPEQIRGEDILPRSDIYSMGIVLFYMLAGRPPHRVADRTGTYDIIDLQLNGQLPSLKQACPDIPEGIDQLYQYCTATDPEQRYQSIETFLPCVEEWHAKLSSPVLV